MSFDRLTSAGYLGSFGSPRTMAVLGHVQWRDIKTVLQAQETTKRLYYTIECL
jgi:hypothetical protein